jgi:type II secretory pathway component PulM
MSSDTGSSRRDHELSQAQRLLEELYRQRAELGEIATELISLLEAAGVSTTDGPDNRAVDSSPD